jgi:hypothetical protein
LAVTLRVARSSRIPRVYADSAARSRVSRRRMRADEASVLFEVE